MSWEDDDFGIEFIKFEAKLTLGNFWDNTNSPNHSFIVVEPLYDSIIDYENSWRKKRKRIRVNSIKVFPEKMNLNDEVVVNENLWLDMGARLFNAIKPFAVKKIKYLTIQRSTNPQDRFDTWYEVKEYKLRIQKKITPKSK